MKSYMYGMKRDLEIIYILKNVKNINWVPLVSWINKFILSVKRNFSGSEKEKFEK